MSVVKCHIIVMNIRRNINTCRNVIIIMKEKWFCITGCEMFICARGWISNVIQMPNVSDIVHCFFNTHHSAISPWFMFMCFWLIYWLRYDLFFNFFSTFSAHPFSFSLESMLESHTHFRCRFALYLKINLYAFILGGTLKDSLNI